MKNLEDMKKLAKKTLLETGQHMPQVCVFGGDKSLLGVFADFPDKTEEKTKLFLGFGAKLAEDGPIEALEEVYFISEAWAGSRESFEKKGQRPSEQLERVEVLIIVAKDVVNKEDKLVSYRMIRDAKGKLFDVKEMGDMGGAISFESPLLKALVFGFDMAKRKPMTK